MKIAYMFKFKYKISRFIRSLKDAEESFKMATQKFTEFNIALEEFRIKEYCHEIQDLGIYGFWLV